MILAERAARLAGAGLRGWRPLSGGDLSEVVRVELDDGRVLVAKRGSAVEAAMLRAIARTGAPAPEVIAAADGVLVMAEAPSDGALDRAWGDIGAGVRTLHAATGSAFGWEDDHAFASVTIPGGFMDDWSAFWAEKRLLPSVPHVPAATGRRVEALARRLPGLLPARPRAALLHGDLWTGNLLVAGGQLSALIDPACLWGHVEVDLAMLELFGRPGPDFWAAYGQREAGWEARKPIYTLWPALVHLRLFGRSYLGMVDGLLAASGG